MTKKVIGLLALVSAMLLTGCDTSSGSKNVIKFQFLKAGLGLEVYQKLAKAYEAEHPGVQVKLIPNYDVNADVDKHLSSGNCSDIYSIRDIGSIKRYYVSKQIIDLKDVVYNAEIEDGKTLMDLIDPSAASYSEYNGAYISVPEYMNVNGFVYNKKLFQQYGWEIPTTTEEMLLLCQRIVNDTNGQTKPFVTCASADGYFYYLLNGINSAYEGLKNLEDIYKFDTPEIFNPVNRTGKLRALETMRAWYLEGNGWVVKGSLGYTHIQAQTALLENKAAMMLNGSWFENEMAAYINPEIDEMAMFPVPEYSEAGEAVHNTGYTINGGKRIINCEYTANYIIPAKAKNKEGAIDFLKFINRSDMCELYTKTCNSVRPLNYNKNSADSTYSSMSTFGKSVLDMANNCQSFVPVSKSQYVITAGLDLWPLDNDKYHIKAMLTNGEDPVARLQKEYELAKKIIK